MSDTAIALPPRLYVRWSCRRCGHTGGSARCNVPVNDFTEAMMRVLFDELRRKLIQIHLRGQGCVATVEDFIVERGVPEGKTIVGVV